MTEALPPRGGKKGSTAEKTTEAACSWNSIPGSDSLFRGTAMSVAMFTL